jgi:hypothetical protein
MNMRLLRGAIGWGFTLWFVGYVLGIILFVVVSTDLIGWIISPIGIVLTLWVLLKKIKSTVFQHYLYIAIIWTIIAIIFDYIFLVQMFKPADGYYKPDVYLYYLLTLLLPILVGYLKTKQELHKQ